MRNLIGQRFNRLTVIRKLDEKTKDGRLIWLCQCDCDKTKIVKVRGGDLTSGNTKSCGCAKKLCRIKDLTGKKFGRLTVIKLSHTNNGYSYWVCKCDCSKNKEIIISGQCLREGKTKSCKCYKDEVDKKRCKENHPQWNTNREQVKLNKKMKDLCGNLIRNTLRRTNNKKELKSCELLGYTRKDLTTYLNIKNVKDLKDKHIDHIFPIKAFLDYGIEDPSIINALDNLQVLSAKENLNKKDKYDKEKFEEYLKNKGISIQ